MASLPVIPSMPLSASAVLSTLSLALFGALPGAAAAQAPQCTSLVTAPVVRLPLGKSTVVRPRDPVARILLGNPDHSRAGRPAEMEAKPAAAPAAAGLGAQQAANNRPGVADIDVLLLSSAEIYLLGKSLGTTNVVMLDRKGGCTAFDVVVDMDTVALQSVIQQLLPEERDIKVTAAFDSIVLSGTVSDSEALTRVTDLANAYTRSGQGATASSSRVVNMLGVAAPQQVMLDVKVAEVSKALIEKFGASVGVGPRGIGNSSVAYNALANFLSGGNAVLNVARGLSTTVQIDAQKDDGQVRVLAEPSIMAVSGQTGSFLAGGKIFIPVSQSNANGGRDVTLEEKEFGVSVKFTPTVLGGGRINLRVRPEVSELSREGVTLASSGGTSVLPSLTSRKAETTVQLMDGQSFAIGGLIKNNTSANVKAFPFLGDLPVIGALFRSSQFQNDRTELVFVVTPHLVKPLPADYKLPTDVQAAPSRADLLLFGRVDNPATPPERSASPAQPAAASKGGGFDAPTTEVRP